MNQLTPPTKAELRISALAHLRTANACLEDHNMHTAQAHAQIGTGYAILAADTEE
jgi:hypothetical protein